MEAKQTEGKVELNAALQTAIGIPDGIFGDELIVDVTKDGLEFGGGYSTLSWEWIFRAFSIVRRADIGSPDHP